MILYIIIIQKYFFQARPEVVNIHYGDISQRQELRNRLNCKSFDWYMKNIYPELKIPNSKEEREKKKKKKKKSSKMSKSDKIEKKINLKALKTLRKYQIQLSDTSLCLESETETSVKWSKIMLQKCSFKKRQVSISNLLNFFYH